MTLEGRRETLPVGTRKAGARPVSPWFCTGSIQIRSHVYTPPTRACKGDTVYTTTFEQLLGLSHCEINEFFAIGTLTAARVWISRSVEPFMTMTRPMPAESQKYRLAALVKKICYTRATLWRGIYVFCCCMENGVIRGSIGTMWLQVIAGIKWRGLEVPGNSYLQSII